MPTIDLDEPTLTSTDVQTLGTQTMDLCAHHARLEHNLTRVEAEIRTTLRDLVNTHAEPDTVRTWLQSQPFAILGWRIPANCLPIDRDMGLGSTADTEARGEVATTTAEPVAARSGNGNKTQTPSRNAPARKR
jgi:hypothetical protein